MTNYKIRQLVLASSFMCLGMVLPFLTVQNPKLGNVFCLMHIPVILCGFICGKKYGLIVGFITPLLRSLIFGMPVMYPVAITMAFELATYGFISGLLYNILPKKNIYIYISLIIAMICGRVILCFTKLLLLWIFDLPFVFQIYFTDAFITCIPGLIIQIVLIPILVMLYNKIYLTRQN